MHVPNEEIILVKSHVSSANHKGAVSLMSFDKGCVY